MRNLKVAVLQRELAWEDARANRDHFAADLENLIKYLSSLGAPAQ